MRRGLCCLVFLMTVGCGDKTTEPASDTNPAADVTAQIDGTSQAVLSADEIKRALLGHVADDVVLPTLTAFAEKAEVLVKATETYAADMTPENLALAQTAWRDAMAVWQQAELMQLGPAGMMGEVLGGKDFRDEIYSWSITNPCRVDQETLEEAYLDGSALRVEAVNVRGLDTIEYLLFHPVEGNGCNANSGINKNGTWKSMADEIVSRQARYAATAASLVQEMAQKLLQAWDNVGGDFAGQLKSAGEGDSLYGTVQEGLNAITDAMFYLEKTTKDMKLAEPAGIAECDTDVCVDALESRWAQFSKEEVLNNLKGLFMLFYGGPDPAQAHGFDDLLVAVGAQALAEDMTAKLNDAITAVETFEGTFADALTTDPDKVQAVFTTLKSFTDLMKTQFMAVLDLEIPSRAASDND
jgi:predicted lipoprotein